MSLFLGTKAVTESPQKPEEKRGEKRKASEVEDNGKKVWTVRWQPPRWEKIEAFQLSTSAFHGGSLQNFSTAASSISF